MNIKEKNAHLCSLREKGELCDEFMDFDTLFVHLTVVLSNPRAKVANVKCSWGFELDIYILFIDNDTNI